MPYKITSRNNLDNENLQNMPAVLDGEFVDMGNVVESGIFMNESDILAWLESRLNSRNIIKNDILNKTFSIYEYTNDDYSDVMYKYSLRLKKQNEVNTTYVLNSVKKSSSFKKFNISDFSIHTLKDIQYSSDMFVYKYQLYEGIYPLDLDIQDTKENDYFSYVKTIYNQEAENHNKEYELIFATTKQDHRWIDIFLKKLNIIEQILDNMSNKKYNMILFNTNIHHTTMIKYIYDILVDDNDTNTRIKNLITDPIFFNQSVYQIRLNDTMLTWHASYSHIIRKYKLIPSKRFVDTVITFGINTLFKQYQTKDNLTQIIKNIETLYNISTPYVPTERSMQSQKSRFNKVIKYFT